MNLLGVLYGAVGASDAAEGKREFLSLRFCNRPLSEQIYQIAMRKGSSYL